MFDQYSHGGRLDTGRDAVAVDPPVLATVMITGL